MLCMYFIRKTISRARMPHRILFWNMLVWGPVFSGTHSLQYNRPIDFHEKFQNDDVNIDKIYELM